MIRAVFWETHRLTDVERIVLVAREYGVSRRRLGVAFQTEDPMKHCQPEGRANSIAELEQHLWRRIHASAALGRSYLSGPTCETCNARFQPRTTNQRVCGPGCWPWWYDGGRGRGRRSLPTFRFGDLLGEGFI